MKCFYFVDKIMRYPLFLAIVMCVMVTGTAKREEDRLQEDISEKVLRFHVRANSDTTEDQTLKLAVRDGIIEYLKPVLADAQSAEDTKAILREQISEIEDTARKVIKCNGQNYDVSVYFTEEYFPARMYGAVTLPPGKYQALRVDIGEAKGKNWWCILYPAMCFVESTCAVCDDDKLEAVLTPEEYDFLAGYEIRFKYLTFLNPK